jgi:hypothetical protein
MAALASGADGPVADDSLGTLALPDQDTALRDEGTAPPDEGTAPPDEGTAPPDDDAALAGDAATVYGWLCRLTPHPQEAEDLLIDVLRRSREPAPACLRAASDVTRLQFLTIQSVLRVRGVL